MNATDLPTRIELFGGAHYPNQLALEDFFQSCAVFMNGFGEPGTRTCHSDSYGTIVMYRHLDAALKLLDEQYHPTPDEWLPHVEAWVYGANMQPPLQIVGRAIARRYGIEIDENRRTKME